MRTSYSEMVAVNVLFLATILLAAASGATCPTDKPVGRNPSPKFIDQQIVTIELKAGGTEKVSEEKYKQLQCAILNALNKKKKRDGEHQTTEKRDLTTEAQINTTTFEPTTTKTTEATTEATTTTPEPTTTTPEPTTTMPEPTTTVPEPTTTIPEPTTTMPEPTTTIPEPTTTIPEPTTTMPEPTTTIPEPTTTMPEPTTTMPEPTTTAPKPTTTTPIPTTTTSEPTTTPEPTTTTPKPTTTTPEPTTTTPEPTTTTPEPTTTTPKPTTTTLQPTTTTEPRVEPEKRRRKRDVTATCDDEREYSEDDLILVDIEKVFENDVLRIPFVLYRNDCTIPDDLLYSVTLEVNKTGNLTEVVGKDVHDIYRGLPKEVESIAIKTSHFFWLPLVITISFLMVLVILSMIYCLAFWKKRSYAVQKLQEDYFPVKGRDNPLGVEILMDEGPVYVHTNGYVNHHPIILTDDDGLLVPMSEFNDDPSYQTNLTKNSAML